MFEYLQHVKNLYKDVNYKEADGIYIVYQGEVDIINPTKRKCFHSLGLLESFGESGLFNLPSFEYIGDIYACLHPKKAIDQERQMQEKTVIIDP